MSTNSTWTVTNLTREIVDGYVFWVEYSVTADSASESVNTTGSVELERPEVLIPYEDLSEQLVISWVQSELGGAEAVTAIENGLQAQLDEQAARSSGVPWSN